MRGKITSGLSRWVAPALVTGVLIGLGTSAAGPPVTSTAVKVPPPLPPAVPYDVDVQALAKLDRNTQVPEAQRLFDVFAWQCFLALNWPAKPDGEPDKTKTLADATAKRVWMG